MYDCRNCRYFVCETKNMPKSLTENLRGAELICCGPVSVPLEEQNKFPCEKGKYTKVLEYLRNRYEIGKKKGSRATDFSQRQRVLSRYEWPCYDEGPRVVSLIINNTFFDQE